MAISEEQNTDRQNFDAKARHFGAWIFGIKKDQYM